MKCARLVLALSCMVVRLGAAADFHVADFGAAGDGIADDGPAIRRAVEAAITSGPGARVVLAPGTHRLEWRKDNSHQIVLSGVTNFTIEGNGALLVNSPRNALLSMDSCLDVTVRGFVLDYDPLPFTQGRIETINREDGWFDFRIQAGYRHPVDAYEAFGVKPQTEDWGVVFDSVGRHRKWNVLMHTFMKSFDRSPAGADVCRVVVAQSPDMVLANVQPGDRYVMTFKFGSHGSTFAIRRSARCLVEDITIHMAKYGMTFSVSESPDRNIFRRVAMTYKPGTDRLLVAPRDGFHCKSNRIGPVIENCFFEGLLDDSINIGVTPYWIKSIEAPEVYCMSGRPAAGDVLTAHTPARKAWLEGFVVRAVEPCAANREWSRVTLDREIPDAQINPTNDNSARGVEKMRYTGMYNTHASGAGYIIRNNVFREQRRHAILVRAPGGRIEGNDIRGVGGAGIRMTNEAGHFYEGPAPHDSVIRNNTIEFTQDIPIFVGLRSAGPSDYARNIRIEGNRIRGTDAGCIHADSVAGLVLSNNRVAMPAGSPADATPISMKNVIPAGSHTPVTR